MKRTFVALLSALSIAAGMTGAPRVASASARRAPVPACADKAKPKGEAEEKGKEPGFWAKTKRAFQEAGSKIKAGFKKLGQKAKKKPAKKPAADK
jgi:hypothetical protein